MKVRAFFISALLIVAAATVFTEEACAAIEENCRVATILNGESGTDTCSNGPMFLSGKSYSG